MIYILARKSVQTSSASLAQSGAAKMIMPQENSTLVQNGSRIQQKTKQDKQSSKPINYSTQTEITSYLPMIKQQKKLFTAKEQTKIDEFSLAKSQKKVAAEKIESLSLEERELAKKQIMTASNVACTLEYVDGSTLLRSGTTKTQVILFLN